MNLREMLYFSIAIICKDSFHSFTEIRALGVTSHHLRTPFFSGILCRVRKEFNSGSLVFRAPVEKTSCTCGMCWATIPPDKRDLVLSFALRGRKRARVAASRAWEWRRALGAGGRHGEQESDNDGLRVEMKEKMNRSLNLAAHDVSSDRAYIMH